MVNDFKSNLNIYRLDANFQKLASNFSCGNITIDNFLKSSNAIDSSIGITYVWLDADNKEVLGYYNYTTGSLDIIDNDYRIKSGGAVHLNEFAMAEKCHGLSINEINMSDMLLDDFITRVSYIKENCIGFTFITLRSTNMGYNLYKRHDFEDVEDDMDFAPTEGKDSDGGRMMYLPLVLIDEI